MPPKASSKDSVLTRSGATRSGLTRPSAVGPRLEKSSMVERSNHGTAPTLITRSVALGTSKLEAGTCNDRSNTPSAKTSYGVPDGGASGSPAMENPYQRSSDEVLIHSMTSSCWCQGRDC